MSTRAREAPGRGRAAVYAVLVHVAVLAFLAVSFRFSELDTSYVVKAGPHVIHAFMVGGRPAPRLTPPAPQLHKVPAPPAVRPTPSPGPSAAQRAAARARQKALRQARAQAQARATAEAVAKAKALAQARAVAKARAVARARALAKAKALAEARARLAARKAAEARQKAHLKAEEQAAAVRARARLKREIAQAAARAEKRAAARKAAAQAAAMAARGIVDRYKALIEARVSAAWVAVPGAKGLHCTVLVHLIAGGQVVGAHILRSSGNPVFDRSVITAIYNATPLPVPHSARKLKYMNPLTFVFTAPKGTSP